MAKTQLASTGDREAAPLEVLLALHEVALDTMAHGLCLFDGQERLVICNEEYLKMYNFDPAVVKPGIKYRDIIAHAIERGNHLDVTLDEYYAKRIALVRIRTPISVQQSLADGR